MKVALLKLPSLMPVSSLSFHQSVPPLGIAYIAGILREDGHEVMIIDAVGEDVERYDLYPRNQQLLIHGLSIEELVERIPADTQVVGLTSMFLHEYRMLQDTVALVKQQLPNVKIIAGGENVTSLWEQVLTDMPEIDYCVLGEGEFKAVDLLHALENGIDTSAIAGIAYLDANGTPVQTGLGPRLRELDKIPWPAWDLVPLEAYLKEDLNSGVNRGRSIPMITSRGCPFQCKFCSAPEMWTTRYVTRSPAEVADEIEYYIKKYSIVNVDFNDLTSFLTKKWIKEFCKIVEERGMKFTWQIPSGSRSEVIDDESAELLYRSGCRNYTFAPESGSERLIKLMKKNLKVPKIIEAMKIAKRHKMIVDANIILGVPDEEWSDLWPTYKMILKFALAGIDGIAVMPFGPYPGSAYYQQLVDEGKVIFDDNYIYSSLLRVSREIKSYNPRFTPGQLLFIQYLYLLSFYGLFYLLRPWQLIKTIVNAYNKKEERIMDQFLGTKFRQLKRMMQMKWQLKKDKKALELSE